jgi:hypothetical protein
LKSRFVFPELEEEAGMSEEKKTPIDIEMPEAEEPSGKQVRFSGGSMVGMVVFFVGLVLAAIAMLWMNAGTEEVIASRPEIEKIWVVSRVEGESLATDQDKTITDGRAVMLYLVAYGYDETEDKNFYYMAPPNRQMVDVEIEGKKISKEDILYYDFLRTKTLVYWQKVELNGTRINNKRIPMQEKVSWTRSRKHRMGNKWWAIADVRSDIKQYHFDYVGTMRFVAELEAFNAKDHREVFTAVNSVTKTDETPGRIPSQAHRITMLPGYRDGLDRAYRAFFNTFAFQDQREDTDLSEVTSGFTGGDSRSVLIGAIKLMGYEVDYDDDDFLNKVAEKRYDNVLIDDFNFFRVTEAEGITVGDEGIKAGDIIKAGERYMVFVRNDPSANDTTENGVLNDDDFILDAWNDVVRQRRLISIIEKELPKEGIEIWRLKAR